MRFIIWPLLTSLLLVFEVSASRGAEYTVETFEMPFKQETVAFSINNLGEIAGTSFSTEDGYRFFQRASDGAINEVPKTNWSTLTPTMATEQLEFVGNGLQSGQFEREWGVVDVDGVFHPFDLTAVTSARWVGKTADGRLFGSREYASPVTELFVEQREGGFSFYHQDTEFYHLEPSGVNALGQIVGFTGKRAGGGAGFIFDSHAETFTAVDFPGAEMTRLWAINDRGYAVGNWYGGGTGGSFLMRPDGVVEPIKIPALEEWGFQIADVNNRGQLVGSYMNIFGGFTSFVATPVPEPSSAALAGLGMFVGVAAASRRHSHQVKR